MLKSLSVAGVLALASGAVLAQGSLTVLLPPPGFATAGVSGISHGGHVIVGYASGGSPAGSRAVRWGPDRIGQAITGATTARAVSADGQVVIGSNYRWTQAGGLVALQMPPNCLLMNAFALNKDGAVVVGSANELIDHPSSSTHAVACRWDGATPTVIQPPAGYFSAGFSSVSWDAQVMVGSTSIRTINPPADFSYGHVYTGGGYQVQATQGTIVCVSGDGRVAAGRFFAAVPGGPQRGFRITGGVVQELGTAPGSTATFPVAISEDGSVIVGFGAGGVGAVLWRADLGVVTLNAYLPAAGINLTGWNLTQVSGVSADACQTILCGNGLFNGLERGWVVTLGTGPDTDGDSICDNWETGGIPYTDSQGVEQRYILDSNGDGVTDASPLQKDVFVEVDAMAGRAPSQAALNRVITAFDIAPVTAPPGGLPGIKLHLVRDETTLPVRPYPSPFTEFQQDKAAYFGTPGERADAANWALKNAAKAKAYRYCIFADGIYGNGTSGVAEGFGCNDFIVSLGSYPDGSGGFGGSQDQTVGTFMHELGHAMGLHHGGADDILYKPNYYSVMNYMWQMPHASFNPGGPQGTWEPIYSDRAAPPLLESALSETAGIGEFFPPARIPFTVPGGTGICPSPVSTCTHWAVPNVGDPVDWNCDGVINPQLVSVNLNTGLNNTNLPPGQLLSGHDDWSNLIYNFRNTPHFANGAPPVNIGQELTLEMHEYLSTLPDRDRAFCSADFDGDGDFGTDLDIEAFFTCLGGDCCATCHTLGADFDGDGDWGTDLDIESFFRVLGGGPC